MEGKFPGAENVEKLWKMCNQAKTSKITPIYSTILDSLIIVELNNCLLEDIGDSKNFSTILEVDYSNISNYLSDLYD